MGKVYKGSERTVVAEIDDEGAIRRPGQTRVVIRPASGQTILRGSTPNVIASWAHDNGKTNIYFKLSNKLLGALAIDDKGKGGTVLSTKDEEIGRVEADSYRALVTGAAILLIPGYN